MTKKQTKDLNRHFAKDNIQMPNKHMKEVLDIISHQGNANQNHKEIPLTTCCNDDKLNHHQRKQNVSTSEDLEKLEPLHIAGRNVK